MRPSLFLPPHQKMSIAKEAWPFAVPLVLASGVALALRYPRTALALFLVGLLLLAFFRIPKRRFDGPEHLVLAPANGVVTRIDRVEDPAIGQGRMRRIVTFLSVFDIHVQRSPVSGEVVRSSFRDGLKRAAFREDAGEVNQSHLVVIRRPSGDLIGVRQIAGLVARRVVSYLRIGDSPARGDLIGLIKFGSRVDLYLPDQYRIEVKKGQRLVEGLTIVAAPATDSPGAAARDGSKKDRQEVPR